MSNPDLRNKGGTYTVRVYFDNNAEHEFPARDETNAREIAKRVVTECAWIVEKDGVEVFYPVHRIFKVKIITPSQAGKGG